jgi:hypothetical protein
MNPSMLDANADPDGIVTSPDQLRVKVSTLLLVKGIADRLERHYPGWLWAVRPDERGGVITIFSLRLSGQYGYLLHTAKIQNDPHHAAAIRAGGEILERFRQRRGAYDYQRWQAAPRYMGGVAMDISDKDRKIQRRYRDDEFTRAVRKGDIEIRHHDVRTETGTHRQLFIRPAKSLER